LLSHSAFRNIHVFRLIIDSSQAAASFTPQVTQVFFNCKNCWIDIQDLGVFRHVIGSAKQCLSTVTIRRVNSHLKSNNSFYFTRRFKNYRNVFVRIMCSSACCKYRSYTIKLYCSV